MAGINTKPHYGISPVCLTPDNYVDGGVKKVDMDWYDTTLDDNPIDRQEQTFPIRVPVQRPLAQWYDATIDMTVGVPGVSPLAISHAVQITVCDNDDDVTVTIKQTLNGLDFVDMPTALTHTFSAGERASHIFNLAGFSASMYQIVYQRLSNGAGKVAFWVM